jgi:hypothetical protein
MKRGFKEYVGTKLIPENPGKTAVWYAKRFIELFPSGSDAEDKIQSLASTLNKQVQTGMEKRVWRKKINGIYHYYPNTMEPASTHDTETFVQISLSMQELKEVDNLVAVDKFKTQSSAAKWLLMEGIKVNRGYLNKVSDTLKQIDFLKQGLNS